MPQLSTRIVGGLGVLLLSPTVLTAAARYRQELADSPSDQVSSGTPGATGRRPEATGRTPIPSRPPVPASPLWGRRDLRTRIAVTASGLVAATSVAYTAPGTPWAQADVFSAPTIAAGPGAGSAPGPATAHGARPGHPGSAATGEQSAGPGAGQAGPAAGPGAGSAADDSMAHEQATYSGVVRTPGRTFLVDATPVRAGTNTLAVTVINADSAPADVKQWTATASLPGTADVPVPLKAFGDGVAAADADLPVAGKWTLTVTVQVAGSTAPITFTQAIPITN